MMQRPVSNPPVAGMICNQAAERLGVAAWTRLGSLAPVRGGVGAISA